MSIKVYEIITREGRHLHKYEIYRLRNGVRFHEGTLIGESSEKLCEQHGWKINECEFIKTSFSFWDYSDATVVKEEIREGNNV